MSVADLTLRVGGRRFTDWTSIRVTRGIERAAGDFALGVGASAQDDATPEIEIGADCTILLAGAPVLVGAIDGVAQSYDATDASFSVSGRSLTGQLCDCSALSPPAQYRGRTITEIATALAAPYDVLVSAEGVKVGAPFPLFTPQLGETVFASIERLARLRGLLVTDDARGRLVLTRASTARAEVALVYGQNILTARGHFSMADCFSEYRCRGQTAGTDDANGAVVAQAEGTETDPGVTRVRILVLVPETGASIAACRDRARWEAATRAGRSVLVTYTVRGWQQRPDGPLWAPNLIVGVSDRRLGVEADMLIAEVDYSVDAQGEVTTLVLQPPGAFELRAAAERRKPIRDGVRWIEGKV